MDKCIFCGSKENITREHIIPKTVFKGAQLNLPLVTLPSCKDCNNSYKEFEDRFITFLHFTKGIEKKEILKKVERQFSNPKLKNEHKFYRDRQKTELLNGEQRISFDLDEKAMREVIFKICKGLYYLNYSEILIWNDYEIIISRKEYSDLSDLQRMQKQLFLDKFNFSTLEKGQEFPGYFRYEYNKIEDRTVVFKLIFYDDIEFFAIFFTL